MGTGTVSTGAPSRLRSFDPVRIADLEYRMWVGYYQQRWTQVLAAAVRLAWLGFGTDWVRTLQGAWLLLRAIQLWAPFPGNDPDGARTCMRQLYALVKLRYGRAHRPGAGQRGDHGPVGPVWLGADDLTAQDRDLMPQYQDLHVFGDVAAGEQRQPAEHPEHEQIDQAEEHEC